MSFSILVGLALDYDIFLISRLVRPHGLARSALLHTRGRARRSSSARWAGRIALRCAWRWRKQVRSAGESAWGRNSQLRAARAGFIITAAGVIMSVSFAGLLLPRAVVLNQVRVCVPAYLRACGDRASLFLHDS